MFVKPLSNVLNDHWRLPGLPSVPDETSSERIWECTKKKVGYVAAVVVTVAMSMVTLPALVCKRSDDISFGKVGKHGCLQCSVKTVDSGFKIIDYFQ